MRFRLSQRFLWLAGPALLASCSATEQTSESSAPRATPTSVVTDADRRAIYESNRPARTSATSSPVPDATPNTQRLGEQASEINRLKRPESLNTNDPNNTTPETRLQRIDESIPDTLRRP